MEISSSCGLKKTIKLARGLIFEGFFNPWYEEIPVPETQPILKSYISKLIVTFEEKIRPKFSILAHRMAFKITAKLNLVIFRLENGLKWPADSLQLIILLSLVLLVLTNSFFSQLRCFLNNREPTHLMFVSP